MKPILCYGYEIWAIVGNRTDLDKLERIQQGSLKRLLGVQTQTTNLAEDSLCSFHGQALAGKYMDRMDADRLLKQALLLIADCMPPSHGDPAMKTSCTTTLCHRQLRTSPTVDSFPFHQHNSSIYSRWASRPLPRAKLGATSKRAMPLNHTSSSRTTDTSGKS